MSQTTFCEGEMKLNLVRYSEFGSTRSEIERNAFGNLRKCLLPAILEKKRIVSGCLQPLSQPRVFRFAGRVSMPSPVALSFAKADAAPRARDTTKPRRRRGRVRVSLR